MGKKIDRFVLTLAAAGAFYLYFQRAFHNKILALTLSVLTCLVFARLLRGGFAIIKRCPFVKRHNARKCAGGALMELACLPADAAREILEKLLRADYAGEYAVSLIQAHPAAQLSQNRLFEVWKAHRGQERLALCVTCQCDTDCRALAASLKNPRLAIIDGQLIYRLFSEHPELIPAQKAETPAPKRILHRAAALLIRRKNAPRCLLFSGALILMYLFSGNIFYLIFSMFLLFVAIAAIKSPSRPARLF